MNTSSPHNPHSSNEYSQNSVSSEEQASASAADLINESHSVHDVEREFKHLGGFEVAFKMHKMASHNEEHNTLLDAGRGNPNWIEIPSRLAFARLLECGVKMSEKTIHHGQLAGYIVTEGSYRELTTLLNPSESKIDDLLLKDLEYGIHELGFDPDSYAAELINGVLGNNYPSPSRALTHCETIVNRYLSSILYERGAQSVEGSAQENLAHARHLEEHTDLFFTEGGTAAICYFFDALRKNNLIAPNDRIALNTPIFAPYISIPHLSDYDLVEINLQSKEEDHWKLSEKAIEALAHDDTKLLVMVNPSNPGAIALQPSALKALQELVKEKPDLMIVTDDVYAPFAHTFESIYSVLPYNTALIYSFSKLYGATGWRLGVVGIQKGNNVFDHLISELPQDTREDLNKRYRSVSDSPSEFSFINRMAAESRSIGLYHTSGLSTPQQIMLTLFSLSHLLTANPHSPACSGVSSNPYIEEARELMRQRYKSLYDSLGIKPFESPENTKYYALIDVYRLADIYYGKEFSTWMKDHFNSLDFIYQLSRIYGVVTVNGASFGTDPGILRISDANLPDEAYPAMGKAIRQLMSDYHDMWEKKEDTLPSSQNSQDS